MAASEHEVRTGAADPLAEAVHADGPAVRIIGAPGTGKTTAALRLVAARVAAGQVTAGAAVVLSSSRVEAARVRALLTRELAATTSEPLARTVASLAVAILADHAAAQGDPEPLLLTGAEQDAILADLLAGHRSGQVIGPSWPEAVWPALATRGFRDQVRDLFMRVAERGLGPAELAALGRRHHRPEWVAASRLLREYEQVVALSRPGCFDPATVVTAAADALAGDEALLERTARRFGLVVVDDAQELTAAGARLVALLGRGGSSIVLAGDPDATVQSFRGADPRMLGDGWVDLLGGGVDVRLRRSLRQPAALAEVTARVAERIGVTGVADHRRPEPAPGTGRAEVAVVGGQAEQTALIADTLRRAHLIDGIPWSQMAVLSRSRSQLATLRRGLADQHIPVGAGDPEQRALRDDPIAGDLLTILGWSIASVQGQALDPDEVTAVLAGPFAMLDGVSAQRLRRALARQLPPGDHDPLAAVMASDTLADALDDVAPPAVVTLARSVQAGRVAVTDGADPHEALWAVWRTLDVAQRWRSGALRGGRSGARFDAALDVVVRLMAAAAEFAARRPGAAAAAFVEELREQSVLADSLAAKAPSTQNVAVSTVAGVAGREWALVVVAGVQEGAWPDLRLRDTLLGAERLVDVVAGRGTGTREAVTAIRHDELRLFHVAVSRATQRLLVTAVSDADEQPSALLDLVDPQRPGERTAVTEPLTPEAVVARLRRLAAGPDEGTARAAAIRLAQLAQAGVAGADPRDWAQVRAVSDDRPVYATGVKVPLSPSKLQTYLDCPLRWVLTGHAAVLPSGRSAQLGTIVHEVAARAADDTDEAAMQADLDVLLAEAGWGTSWSERREVERAREMVTRLARYARQARDAGREVVGIEVAMAAELDGAVISGRVDRLERDADGRLLVIDLKTSKTPVSAPKVALHPQLAAYQVAVDLGAFEDSCGAAPGGGAGLLQLGTSSSRIGVSEQPALTQEGLDQAVTDLEQIATGMAGRRFNVKPGGHCRTCPVRSSCPVTSEREES